MNALFETSAFPCGGSCSLLIWGWELSSEQEDRQQQRAAQDAKATLTNEAIIEMVNGGLSADVVVQMIESHPAKFAVLPDDLLAETQAAIPPASDPANSPAGDVSANPPMMIEPASAPLGEEPDGILPEAEAA